MEINERFQGIDEVISEELREVDQQMVPRETIVFDEELMKRVVRDTWNSIHASNPEMYKFRMKSVHDINNYLYEMIEAGNEYKVQRVNCENEFLQSLFYGDFDILKTEIGHISIYEPHHPKRIGKKALMVKENIFFPAKDLPQIDDDRVVSLLTCIRHHYFRYKESRNSKYKIIQNMLCVLQIALELL